MDKVQKTEQEWRAELTPEQYRVLREKGTERPFTGEYDHTFDDGVYRCAGCGTELFTSESKYDSGCGWPAFSAPADAEAIDEETDTAYGMVHAEVVEVTYDEDVVPYQALLATFWAEHDPTQLNRQGPDVGDQYRSVIFVHDEDQRAAAQASREQVQARISKPVVTQIEDAPPF